MPERREGGGNLNVYYFNEGFHGFREEEVRGWPPEGMEVFHLGEGLALVSDGDGWIKRLQPTAEVIQKEGGVEGICHIPQLVYGACYVCRIGPDGNPAPAKKEDEGRIRKRVAPH